MDYEFRTKVIKMHEERPEMTMAQVASALGGHRANVAYWAKKENLEFPEGRPGRPRMDGQAPKMNTRTLRGELEAMRKSVDEMKQMMTAYFAERMETEGRKVNER